LSAFFAAVGAASPLAPKVLYDDMSDRFVVTAMDGIQTNNSSVLMAVSDTADPAASWTLYRFAADPQGLTSAGVLSSIGVNSTWIVLATGMFQNTPPNSFVNSTIYAIDKNNLLANKQLSFTRFQDQGYAPSPIKGYDTSFPIVDVFTDWNGDSNGNGLIRHGGIFGNVGQEHYNPAAEFIASSGTWSSSPPAGNVNFLPQLGSSTGIYGGDGKITNAVLRNNMLYAVHSVYRPASGGPTHMAVHWITENTITGATQDGFIEDATAVNNFDEFPESPTITSYAFPSVAVNCDDDVIVAYSAFSMNSYPGSAISSRYGGDLPASGFGSPIILGTGSGPYVHEVDGKNIYGPALVEILFLNNFSDLLSDREILFLVLQPNSAEFWEAVDWLILFHTYEDPRILRVDTRSVDVAVGPPTGTDISHLVFANLYPTEDEFDSAEITSVSLYFPTFGRTKIGTPITLLLGSVPKTSLTISGGVNWDFKQPATVSALGQWVPYTLSSPYPLHKGMYPVGGVMGPPDLGAGTNTPLAHLSFTSLDGGVTFGADGRFNFLMQATLSGGLILTKKAGMVVYDEFFNPIAEVGGGRAFKFTFEVTNLSGADISGLNIVDPLPPGFRVFDFTVTDPNARTRPVSPPLSVKAGETTTWGFYAIASDQAGTATNTAMLNDSAGIPRTTASDTITVQAATGPLLDRAFAQNNGLFVGGSFRLAFTSSSDASVRGSAAGPVILVNGVRQKTVADSILPNNVLIAPRGAKKIKPGHAVTIQVRFPDGTTTNSITYTRP
jgi:uncharacterized repeat protein (TIGR01451 family)